MVEKSKRMITNVRTRHKVSEITQDFLPLNRSHKTSTQQITQDSHSRDHTRLPFLRSHKTPTHELSRSHSRHYGSGPVLHTASHLILTTILFYRPENRGPEMFTNFPKVTQPIGCGARV